MKTPTAYQLELQPSDGQTAHQCLSDVCGHLAHFVLVFYKQNKIPFPTLTFDGRCERPTNGHQLVASRYPLDRYELVTLDWEMAALDNPAAAWRFHFLCAADNRIGKVELQCRVAMGPRFVQAAPNLIATIDTYIAHPMGLMDAILSRWPARVDGWPVPVTEQLLQAEDIPTFVDKVLLNPKRALSVILLAGDGRFKCSPANLKMMQRRFLGVAHLAILTNPEASECLTAVLGPERACPVGVLRIYYPGFCRDAPPADHPFFQGDDLKQMVGNRLLEAVLRDKVMPRLARRLPDGPTAWAARAAVCGQFTRHIGRVHELRHLLECAEDKVLKVQTDRDWSKLSSDQGARQMRAAFKKLQSEYDQIKKVVAAADSNRERSRRKMEEARQAAGAAQDDAFAVRRELEICRQDLASVSAERDAALAKERQDLADVSAERDAALAKERQTQDSLQVLRANLEARQTPPVAGESPSDTELERAWEENTQVLVELEAARQELATLKEELAVAKENLALITAAGAPRHSRDEGPPAATSPSPRTVADALRTAAQQHSDVLVVWDEAWRSAEKSLYTGPSRVLLALKAVAEIGREYFASLHTGQPLGPLEQAFHSRVPFKYAPSESRMTMAMYGRERLFQGPGERLEIQRHLTLGGGGNCVQVYFHFDESSEKAIIAYCGQHLPHYRQR